MNLIFILLFATAVLTLLIGFLTFLGSSKADKVRSAWLGASYIGGAFWVTACAIFLQLPESATGFAPFVVDAIYIGALLLLTALWAYASWQYSFGRIVTVLYAIASLAISAIIIFKPELYYTAIVLSPQGNSVDLVNGWAYWAFAVTIASASCAVVGVLIYHALHTANKRSKPGDIVLAVGITFTGIMAAIFNILLPLFVRYDLIWIGPLTMSVMMLAHFYSILKYRIIAINGRWLKLLSYGVVLSMGVIVYMVIFYLIFTALFKIPNPSTSVLVLNFLMVVIVLLLMPVIQEIMASVNSMIQVGQVDIAYVIKKLNHLATRNVDLRELAGFLADHLHFAYIGFIINGRLYGSKALAMSPEELSSITHLRQTANGVWQEPNKTVQKAFDELGLKAVAELKNAKGKTFGQLIVGKPLGKSSFERRDLIQLEMIINLVATVIDSEKHLRA